MAKKEVDPNVVRFLEEAGVAARQPDWRSVKEHALDALALDRQNADARRYIEAAEFRLGYVDWSGAPENRR